MSVLSLDDAKSHLNSTKSVNDAELQSTIDAAEAAIAKRVGPLAVVSVTSRVQGCTDALYLPTTPVVSLTSVTPVGGSAIDVSSLTTSGGTVSVILGGSFYGRLYDVTYTAGRSTVPDDLLFAIKQMVKHLWESQRATGVSGDAPAVPYFSFPNAVSELLSPYVQGGFA